VTWAWANQNPVWIYGLNLGECERVFAMHDWLRAKLTQVLNQVVDEGVVVIDHKDSGHQDARVEPQKGFNRTGSV
jgi:hypothetical protein